MLHRAPCFVPLVAFLSASLCAQELPPVDVLVEVETNAIAITELQQDPAGVAALDWAPVLVLLPGAAASGEVCENAMRTVGAAAARAGFRVFVPLCGGGSVSVPASQVAPGGTVRVAERPVDAAIARLCREPLRNLRIAGGGVHVVVMGDVGALADAVLKVRHHVQTFTVLGDGKDAEIAAVRKLPARRVHVLAAGDAAAHARHFAALRAEREPAGAAAAVARALDDFHDAAAKGDEDRYFAILPDDAVFLGTDLNERWTGTEFRKFAMPYFQRAEAWTYVPLQRHVTMEPGDTVAWFDEVLANDGYGECRGTGVLVKRGERWVLRQYDLTIPVPNELADGICKRIRAFTDGKAPAVTTIVVVRHAEKVDASTDAALSDTGRARAEALAKALHDLPITAAYTTEFQRTAATVAPVCTQRAFAAKVVKAADGKALARTLKREHLGQTVLVCGHSNTVPALLKDLGIGNAPAIADDEFDRLFVVTLGPDGAQMLTLRY